MNSTPRLADYAVAALAEVRAMGETLDNDHPMRHAVRNMKRTAEQILESAMRQACDLAYQSKQVVKDYDAEMEAKEPKA
jgi:hypothetical protein